jgi:hypothetical protein
MEKKNGLYADEFISFTAVLFTVSYALLLMGFFDSIRYELLGLLTASLFVPQILFAGAALVLSIVGIFAQKRWCMFASGVLMAVASFFIIELLLSEAKALTLNVAKGSILSALPAMLLFFAYAEMSN